MSQTNHTPRPDPMRHAGDIMEYGEQDSREMPPPGGIVFTGSSSVRLWEVDKAFPGLPVINRGFGGSIYADAIHFFEQIIPPYKPKTVVLYSGDNDLACELRPEEVLADFRKLVEMIFADLPAARVVCMSTKPSISRWHLDENIRRFNALMEQYTRGDDRLFYVDVYHPMLGVDNKPIAELYREDGLHMTQPGYDVWNAAVRPYLEAK